MLALLLLSFGILSRFIIHIPNFVPVVALALFSGAYFKKSHAFLFPLLLMIISDSFIGFYDGILFTWGSLALVVCLGFWTKHHKNPLGILGGSFLAALIFFIGSNFGTWAMSTLYPHTAQGLRDCFILAVPFFRATLVSTVIYSAIFFSVYELIARGIKDTKLAPLR